MLSTLLGIILDGLMTHIIQGMYTTYEVLTGLSKRSKNISNRKLN